MEHRYADILCAPSISWDTDMVIHCAHSSLWKVDMVTHCTNTSRDIDMMTHCMHTTLHGTCVTNLLILCLSFSNHPVKPLATTPESGCSYPLENKGVQFPHLGFQNLQMLNSLTWCSICIITGTHPPVYVKSSLDDYTYGNINTRKTVVILYCL
jgi:hypothetical protein